MTARASAGPSREEALRLLRESYAGPAWHGPSLLTALRGLEASDAGRRPAPGRNSPWELALHCAYARHRVLGRLDRALGGRFPRRLARDWWPAVAGDDADAWAADLALLDDYQARLVDAVERLPAARLAARRAGQAQTLAGEVAGVALHDVYHAGQIVLLRKLRAR